MDQPQLKIDSWDFACEIWFELIYLNISCWMISQAQCYQFQIDFILNESDNQIISYTTSQGSTHFSLVINLQYWNQVQLN